MAGIRSVPENKSTSNRLITWQKCDLDNQSGQTRALGLKDEFTIDNTKVHMNRMRKSHSIQQNALIAFTVVDAFKRLSHDNCIAALEEAIAALQTLTRTDATLINLAQNSGAMVNGTISWEENNVYHCYTVQLGTNVSYISHDAATGAEPLHDILHHLLQVKEKERVEKMLGHPVLLRVIGGETIGQRLCNEDNEKKGLPTSLVPLRLSTAVVGPNIAKSHKSREGLFSISRTIGINSIPEISPIPTITSRTIPKTNMIPKKIIVGSNSLIDIENKEKAFVSPDDISLHIHGSNPASTLIQAAFNANDQSNNMACGVYEITKAVTAVFVFAGEGSVGKHIADICTARFCEIFSKILQNKLELAPSEVKAEVNESSLKVIDVEIEEENNSNLPPLHGPFLPPDIAESLRRIRITVSPPPDSNTEGVPQNLFVSTDMTAATSPKKGLASATSSPAKIGTFAKPKTEPRSPTNESRSPSPSSRYWTGS